MSPLDESVFVEVDGTAVRLTHLSKVLFPADGITKAELIRYYHLVAPLLLPHLRGRPLTLKAFPHGITGRPYYRRHLSSTRPPWLHTVELENEPALVVENVADLLWVVNQDSVELHSWLSRSERLHNPDLLLFDLDPGPQVEFQQTCEGALILREALRQLDIESWPKTSGANGIHVLVGINPEYTFEEVHTWVIAIARVLSRTRPDIFTMDYTRSRRTNKILIDHNQVGFGRTTASIYSVRPLPQAPVSAPVTWEEIESGSVTPGKFAITTMPERISIHGDIAAGLVESHQQLPHM